MYVVHIFLFISCLLVCSTAEEYSVSESFENAGIVPDLIDSAPNKKVSVTFVQSGAVVNLGNELKPSQVQNIPRISYHTGHHKTYYTLAFLDPDAPSRQNPFERTFVHWLVGNIHKTHVDNGNTLVAFIGSAPPPDSGEHRYTFLVYKQPHKIEFNETILGTTQFEERKLFSINAFAKKYNLGHPYAGNFYTAFHET